MTLNKIISASWNGGVDFFHLIAVKKGSELEAKAP
jgi:hypothetical protein